MTPSVWQMIYSQCSECAFRHRESVWGKEPVNSSLLTQDHLFRWTLSSMAEWGRERDGETEEVMDKEDSRGIMARYKSRGSVRTVI